MIIRQVRMLRALHVGRPTERAKPRSSYLSRGRGLVPDKPHAEVTKTGRKKKKKKKLRVGVTHVGVSIIAIVYYDKSYKTTQVVSGKDDGFRFLREAALKNKYYDVVITLYDIRSKRTQTL